uniref:Metal-sensitive transcriptional regulator n=1 Tax=Heterorhabditis bacteriophora TaxID=37862 RepID=A0A1I7WJ99_HETBA
MDRIKKLDHLRNDIRGVLSMVQSVPGVTANKQKLLQIVGDLEECDIQVIELRNSALFRIRTCSNNFREYLDPRSQCSFE